MMQKGLYDNVIKPILQSNTKPIVKRRLPDFKRKAY